MAFMLQCLYKLWGLWRCGWDDGFDRSFVLWYNGSTLQSMRHSIDGFSSLHCCHTNCRAKDITGTEEVEWWVVGPSGTSFFVIQVILWFKSNSQYCLKRGLPRVIGHGLSYEEARRCQHRVGRVGVGVSRTVIWVWGIRSYSYHITMSVTNHIVALKRLCTTFNIETAQKWPWTVTFDVILMTDDRHYLSASATRALSLSLPSLLLLVPCPCP